MGNSESALRVSCCIFVETEKTNRKLKVPTQTMWKHYFLVGVKVFEETFLGQVLLSLVSSNEVPSGSTENLSCIAN